jgi:hypothetical protein
MIRTDRPNSRPFHRFAGAVVCATALVAACADGEPQSLDTGSATALVETDGSDDAPPHDGAQGSDGTDSTEGSATDGVDETGGSDAPDDPWDPEDPDAPSYELIGDPEFSIEDLDDTVTDSTGVTLRGWYERLLATVAKGYRDADFDRNSNRPWGRTGNQHVTMLMVVFRGYGDLRLLDEAVRLLELSHARLQTDLNGHLYWDGYDQELDVTLTAGLVACITYAADLNRHLESPAGHDYGAFADAWTDWLFNHYKPRWEGLKNTTGELPFIVKNQQHSLANNIRTLWYMGKLGGGGGHSAQDYFDAVTKLVSQRLDEDAVCADGHEGRDVRVYKHIAAPGSGGSGYVLQYTTYVRYEVSAYLDLMLEGVDERLDDEFFTTWANALADLVLDDDPDATGDALARTIGGDNPPNDRRCGIEYNHTYRSRANRTRWVDGAYQGLEGWDTRRRIHDIGLSYFAAVESNASEPNRAEIPAARIFTNFYHGW